VTAEAIRAGQDRLASGLQLSRRAVAAPAVGPLLALVLTLPAGCTYVSGAAYVFDGSLQNCGNGDKYQAGDFVGGTVYFFGGCHE